MVGDLQHILFLKFVGIWSDQNQIDSQGNIYCAHTQNLASSLRRTVARESEKKNSKYDNRDGYR